MEISFIIDGVRDIDHAVISLTALRSALVGLKASGERTPQQLEFDFGEPRQLELPLEEPEAEPLDEPKTEPQSLDNLTREQLDAIFKEKAGQRGGVLWFREKLGQYRASRASELTDAQLRGVLT
jgi:hypothetical protein